MYDGGGGCNKAAESVIKEVNGRFSVESCCCCCLDIYFGIRTVGISFSREAEVRRESFVTKKISPP